MSTSLVSKQEDCGVATPTAGERPCPLLAGLAVCLAGVLALYGRSFLGLIQTWGTDPDYLHAYLVPAVSVFLAWRWLQVSNANAPNPQPLLGTSMLLAGCVLHAAGTIVVWPLLDFAGLFLVLRGVALVLGGREWARGLAFPMAFLVFMYPLPRLCSQGAAVWLQGLVSQGAAMVLEPLMVVYRQGYELRIPGIAEPVMVAPECSGLRQIMALVALAVLLGYLNGANVWRRVALAAAAVPVAAAVNVIRVVLMVLVLKVWGPTAVSGLLHDLPGLLVFPLGFLLLFLLANTWCAPVASTTPVSVPPVARRRSLCVRVGTACLVLLLAATAQAALEEHLAGLEPVPLELDSLPAEIRSGLDRVWVGQPHPQAAVLARQAPWADGLLVRAYAPAGSGSGGRGPEFSLYAIHSRTGLDREHHPEVCIREVAGLPEDARARKVLPLDGDPDRPVERYRFLKGGERGFLVYYWHYTLGAPAGEEASPLRRLHERFRRRPSLTVQVVLDLDLAAAEREVETDLLPQLDRQLRSSVLPGPAAMGCDRLPVVVVGAPDPR